MAISFIVRYSKFIAIFLVFLAGWYSGYTYYNVKQLKIDLKLSNQKALDKDKTIADMQNSEKITNDILTKSAIQRQQDKINYENVYNKLQSVSKRMDSTNHINAILVRTVQAGINGKTVSYANATSRINEETITYRPSNFTDRIIHLGQNCTENTNQLTSLIEWNLKEYDR